MQISFKEDLLSKCMENVTFHSREKGMSDVAVMPYYSRLILLTCNFLYDILDIEAVRTTSTHDFHGRFAPDLRPDKHKIRREQEGFQVISVQSVLEICFINLFLCIVLLSQPLRVGWI